MGVAWLWFAFITHRTLYDHSGYYFPFTLMSPLTHDFHHSSFTGIELFENIQVKFKLRSLFLECYGTYLGMLDYFHGTNRSFRAIMKKRKAANL